MSDRRRELIRLEEDVIGAARKSDVERAQQDFLEYIQLLEQKGRSSSSGSASSTSNDEYKERSWSSHRFLISGGYLDQEVEVRGWLYNMRSKGKIAFLQIRTAPAGSRGSRRRAPVGQRFSRAWATTRMEASVKVRGKVRTDERAPSGFELTVTGLEVVPESRG